MKTYQKAELIAKNLPTGSYAAGCPTNGKYCYSDIYYDDQLRGVDRRTACRSCEIAE